MKSNTAIRMALGAGILGTFLVASPLALAANCYNGYCANSSSPVVGGGYSGAISSYSQCAPDRCEMSYPDYYILYQPFGNVTYSGTTRAYKIPAGNPVGNQGEELQNIQCPSNTVQVNGADGYTADNGTTYGGEVALCVKTDTN